MTAIAYCRVVSQKQIDSDESKITGKSKKEIKTIVYFKDGASKVLTTPEIKEIFESYLRGECYIRIAKPKKEFDYKGKLKNMEVCNSEQIKGSYICKKYG